MFRIIPENPKTPRKRGFLLSFVEFASLNVQRHVMASREFDGIIDGILVRCHHTTDSDAITCH